MAEIAQATRIAKPLIYNATRAGIERGEPEKVALPAGKHGFRTSSPASSQPKRSPA